MGNDAFARRLARGHRVDVGGGAADIDDQQRPQARLAAPALGQKAGPFQHRRRRRHQHRVEHCRRPVDSLGVDDAFHEHLADGGAGGLDVEPAEFGHDVFGHHDRVAGGFQQGGGFIGGLAVAGDDDRAPVRAFGELGGVAQDHAGVAAVGAAGQEDDVGGKGLDLGHVAPGQSIGEGAGQPGPGAQGRLAGGLGGQFPDQPDGDHAQAPGGAGTRQAVLEVRQRPDPAFQVLERRVQAFGDVGGDRRRALPGPYDPAGFQVDGAELGEGRAEINEQRRGHGFAFGRRAKSLSRASITSSARVWFGKARSKPMSR